MNRIAAIATASLAMLCASTQTCVAQANRGPIFRLQPGLRTVDFVSAPPGVTSVTGFNLRFETLLPTSVRWFTPVIGASVTPDGTNGEGTRNLDTPSLFVGNVFPVVDSRNTAGWATLELPMLLYYSYGGSGHNAVRLYGRDVFAQLALRLHIGAKMLKDIGSVWSRLDAYGFIEQNLTPQTNFVTGKRDRFDPVALLGISISFGDKNTPQ